jgi:hypothetical protein
MPDDYDRLLGSIDGLPGMAKTKPATIRITPPLGIGGSTTFTVTTYRQAGEVLSEPGENPVKRAPAVFTAFVEMVKADRVVRLVLSDAVAALLLRQREVLTAQALRKAGKQAAETRKQRGIKPHFGRKGARS